MNANPRISSWGGVGSRVIEPAALNTNAAVTGPFSASFLQPGNTAENQEDC